MSRYQYQTYYLDPLDVESLCDWAGRSGWKVVSVTPMHTFTDASQLPSRKDSPGGSMLMRPFGNERYESLAQVMVLMEKKLPFWDWFTPIRKTSTIHMESENPLPTPKNPDKEG